MIAPTTLDLAFPTQTPLHRYDSRRRSALIRVAVIATLVVLVFAPKAQSQNVRSDLCQADGIVNAMVASGNTLYIGGGFTHLGTVVGPGAPIDAVTGQVVRPFPVVDGGVTLVAPDGAGGWYIAGSFTSVGGLPRSRLAHINADNTVADWNPTAGAPGSFSAANAIVAAGSTVYIGGEFTQVGGQPRTHIAAVDAVTGNATAWNPSSNSIVMALAVDGSLVYAGGIFSNIGGQSRSCLAAIDASTGLATAWNPSVSGGSPQTLVRSITVVGSAVYACGNFTSLGFKPRNGIGAVDVTTGSGTNFNPNPSGGDIPEQVLQLARGGAAVYAAGSFTSIGGQPRFRIAGLDPTTGNATGFYAPMNGTVNAMSIVGSTVYAGGAFTTVGGLPYEHLAALDASSGVPTAWNPGVNRPVISLAATASTVYVGSFYSQMMVGAAQRSCIAAIDLATGTPTAWNPNADGSVGALALSGSTLYVGGSFSTIAGQTRHYIAALDVATGNATSWDPGSNSNVNIIVPAGSVVYVGGIFTGIGGQSRQFLAALDAATGAATVWNPFPLSSVNALRVSGGTLYVGGNFTTIAGQTRWRIAAFNASTGALQPWDPSAGGVVWAVAPSGSNVYAGGDFPFIGGAGVTRLAAVDATTASATAWSPSPNNVVYSLLVDGSVIYAGGGFQTIGGQNRISLAAVDATTGNALAWSPNPNGAVNALAMVGSTIYAAGNFSQVGGGAHWYLAGIDKAVVVGVPPPKPFVGGLAILGIRPNPSEGDGEIQFTLPRKADVSLRLYDAAGREVARLLEEPIMGSGPHRVAFDGRRLPVGIYVFFLRSGGHVVTRRLALVR